MLLPDSIDLVNASYSLPFISPNDFPVIFKKIRKRIVKGGIFAGHFFSPEDDYARFENVTSVNCSELDNMFKKFNILFFNLNAERSPDSTGNEKQWGVWNIVAEKNKRTRRVHSKLCQD
jgi:tellurite methyltransferase